MASTRRLRSAAPHSNSWFHFLSDHAVTFSVLPVAPDRTLLRTTWLVHADAVEGEDNDVDELTKVWRATNEQDAVLVARAHRGVSDLATSRVLTPRTRVRSRRS